VTYDEIRAELAEINPDAVLFECPNYEGGLIGYTEDGRAVYDREKCIMWLASQDDSETDPETAYTNAIEFFEFNTVRSLPYAGEHAPVIVTVRIET